MNSNILSINAMPDITSSRLRTQHGPDVEAKVVNALNGTLKLAMHDSHAIAGLRYDFNPIARKGPDRLRVALRTAADSEGALGNTHLFDGLYDLRQIDPAKGIPRKKGLHIAQIARAEEAHDLVSIDGSRPDYAFHYCPSPGWPKPMCPSGADIDQLYDGLQYPCMVQITVQATSLNALGLRDDLLRECEELERHVSPRSHEQITSGVAETLRPGTNELASRGRDSYREHLSKMFSQPVFEFSIVIASADRGELMLVSQAFGEWFFRGGLYQVIDADTHAEVANDLYRSLSSFNHRLAAWIANGRPCWSPQLAAHADTLSELIGSRLDRLSRLSRLTRLVDQTCIESMLALPVFGYRIPKAIRLDSDPPAIPKESRIDLGVDLDRPDAVQLGLSSLARHAMVEGATGAGKTSCILNLLGQLWENHHISWLLFDPVKREYRQWFATNMPWISDLRIYTPSNSNVCPLRLNPFVTPQGVTIGEHVNMLHECFTGAFSLGGPFPYLLNQALKRCYETVGWGLDDVGGSDGPWPSMRDLAWTMDEVISEADYAGELDSNFRAAAKTRLESLCQDGIGSVLGATTSFPSVEDLMSHPTIIETDQLTTDEANLLILFLLMVLRQYMSQQSKNSPVSEERPIRHALLLDEAHVLIGDDDVPRSSEDANPQAHASHRFARMLKEMRAMGECCIVADQSSAAIHPEVVRQAQVRIVHQVLDPNARENVATAMLLTEDQRDMLARLQPGEAILWHARLDRPVRMRGHHVNAGILPPSDESLRKLLLSHTWYSEHSLACLRDEISDRIDGLEAELRRMLRRRPDTNETNDAVNSEERIRKLLQRASLQIASRLKMAHRCGLPGTELGIISNEIADRFQSLTRIMHATPTSNAK